MAVSVTSGGAPFKQTAGDELLTAADNDAVALNTLLVFFEMTVCALTISQ
jgi:hypothetical protein